MDGIDKRNEIVLPFRDVNDFRFSWLSDTFLEYLDDWKDSIKSRNGFENEERNRMLLSHQHMRD